MEESSLFLILIATVRLATPLGVAALGESLSQRAGVLNLGIEGYMALATIVAYAGSYYFNDPWIGTLLAVIAATALAALSGFFSITLGLSQIVTGLGIIFFAGGLVSLLNGVIFNYIIPRPDAMAYFYAGGIPLLRDIPVLGALLFSYHSIVYIMVLLAILFWYILYKTKFGLNIRAIGDSTSAADSMGVNIVKTRYALVLLTGAMSGLAGAYLALGVTRTFIEGMVGGRGFIVLAAVVLGKWDPLTTLLACFLFGLINALQYRMQIVFEGIVPLEFWLMLPYLIAILTLALASRKRGAETPKELAVPYNREDRA
jgi:general nucleoside transport system permease protein